MKRDERFITISSKEDRSFKLCSFNTLEDILSRKIEVEFSDIFREIKVLSLYSSEIFKKKLRKRRFPKIKNRSLLALKIPAAIRSSGSSSWQPGYPLPWGSVVFRPPITRSLAFSVPCLSF
jgi:hypothetical protein